MKYLIIVVLVLTLISCKKENINFKDLQGWWIMTEHDNQGTSTDFLKNVEFQFSGVEGGTNSELKMETISFEDGFESHCDQGIPFAFGYEMKFGRVFQESASNQFGPFPNSSKIYLESSVKQPSLVWYFECGDIQQTMWMKIDKLEANEMYLNTGNDILHFRK